MTAAHEATFKQHFVKVSVVKRTDSDGQATISISPIWAGVDRPDVGGFGVRPRQMALALRLKAAMESGAAFSSCQMFTDVNGHTYIGTNSNILGRTMNADLKRLGY